MIDDESIRYTYNKEWPESLIIVHHNRSQQILKASQKNDIE